MKIRPIALLFSIAILIAFFFYYRPARQESLDRSAELEKVIAPSFLKFGFTDSRLVKKTVEENRHGGIRYYSAYVEYNMPTAFSWKGFEEALRRALKRKKFVISDIDKSVDHDRERYTLIINYGKLDIFTLRVNRKVKAVPTAVDKAHAHPKVAIVVDDFGYSRNNLSVFFSLKQPITLSILPEQRFSRTVAEAARAHGFETILHLPLESEKPDAMDEPDTIKTGMDEREILVRLKKEIECLPGIDGVSNHQGSKATADASVMTPIIKYLKMRGMYFFDSLTSPKSVCVDVAKSVGVKCAKRDIFLDNSNNSDAIERQLMDLKTIAFKNGEAIAIGHDRKNTAAVLTRILPEMAKEGIEFVRLSELVKR